MSYPQSMCENLSHFLISEIVSRISMSRSKRDIVAQALADKGNFALSAFVTSLDNDHPSLSIVVPPKGLKEYWTNIRSQGLWISLIKREYNRNKTQRKKETKPKKGGLRDETTRGVGLSHQMD